MSAQHPERMHAFERGALFGALIAIFATVGVALMNGEQLNPSQWIGYCLGAGFSGACLGAGIVWAGKFIGWVLGGFR